MVFAASVLFALLIIIAAPAYAYLDPGAGSFALQMLMAGFLAMAATGRLYWFRIKAFFLKLVGKGRGREPSVDPTPAKVMPTVLVTLAATGESPTASSAG